MFFLLIAIVILSLTLTWGVRHYAIAKNIIDCPNHRSSHTKPTPRGGGVAFILSFLMAVPFIGYAGFLSVPVSIAILGAGLCVAILGFLDDRRHIPASFRLLGHLCAAVFAMYCLGGMPSISFFGWMVPSGLLLNSLAVIYLVWLINLYNFMDGIDGIASIEALCVCLSGVFLYWLNGDYALISLPLALTSAVIGFLWWNFPPARIFMGDAGSGFLGVILGILSIQAAGVASQFFWGWLILLGVFIVDTAVTLLFRLLRGCKIYEAHCSHAYQQAARRLGSHLGVSLGVLVINLFWLLPIAVLVIEWSVNGSVGLIIAYLPLVILAIKLQAGKKDEALRL